MLIFPNICKKIVPSRRLNVIQTDIDIQTHTLTHVYMCIGIHIYKPLLRKSRARLHRWLESLTSHRHILKEIFLKKCYVLTIDHIKSAFKAVSIHPSYTAGIGKIYVQHLP